MVPANVDPVHIGRGITLTLTLTLTPSLTPSLTLTLTLTLTLALTLTLTLTPNPHPSPSPNQGGNATYALPAPLAHYVDLARDGAWAEDYAGRPALALRRGTQYADYPAPCPAGRYGESEG